MRLLRGALGALLLLAMLAACGPTNDQATQQRLAHLASQAAASYTNNVVTTYDGQKQTLSVTATVGWTSDITIADIAKSQERAKTLCFQVQRALWTSGVTLKEATVTVLGPVQDDYADMILDAHGVAELSAKTAAGFDWAALTPDSAWSRYDSVWLRATYQPHVVGSP
jgi:hypothetical protein